MLCQPTNRVFMWMFAARKSERFFTCNSPSTLMCVSEVKGCIVLARMRHS